MMGAYIYVIRYIPEQEEEEEEESIDDTGWPETAAPGIRPSEKAWSDVNTVKSDDRGDMMLSFF